MKRVRELRIRIEQEAHFHQDTFTITALFSDGTSIADRKTMPLLKDDRLALASLTIDLLAYELKRFIEHEVELEKQEVRLGLVEMAEAVDAHYRKKSKVQS